MKNLLILFEYFCIGVLAFGLVAFINIIGIIQFIKLMGIFALFILLGGCISTIFKQCLLKIKKD